MRKILIAALLGLAGCDLSNKHYIQEPKSYTVVSGQVVIFDSCEYVYIDGKYGFSHKGNCKNPIHFTRK